MLLEIKNISKSFNGLKAVDDFSCLIERGTVTGLIGPNGAGKTTLFNIITGFLRVNSGNIFFNKNDITPLMPYRISSAGISRTFQDLRLIMQMTLVENIMLWYGSSFGERLNNIFFRDKKVKEHEDLNLNNAYRLLEFAGLRDKALEKAGNLSYGQQKLLSLACAVSADPELILLDEPVSGIQPEMIYKIKEMIKELQKAGKTIFFIEHDMDFVFSTAERVIVMDHGKKIADGLPQEILDNSEILEAYLS